MGKKKSADEQPKPAIAQRVVAAKRRYFVPDARREVEAESLAEVTKELNKKVKDGDGNK